MRADGTFIAVEVSDQVTGDRQLAARLAEACPVDIFAQGDGGQVLRIVAENLDECVLCRLCLDAAPGVVKVLKLYDDGAELA